MELLQFGLKGLLHMFSTTSYYSGNQICFEGYTLAIYNADAGKIGSTYKPIRPVDLIQVDIVSLYTQ